MTRVTLREALDKVPTYLHGARSPVGAVQAALFADRDQPVFCAGASVETATTDLAVIKRIHAAAPNLSWFLRGRAEDGLVILKGSDEEVAKAECQFGVLPRTLTVESIGGGIAFHIFSRSPASPDFVMQRDVLAHAKVQVVPFCPLPNGASYQWREYCALGELCGGAFLTRGWNASLPAKLGSKPFVPPRSEFVSVRSPHFSGR